MRCRECKALLWSYIDRELAEQQRRAVETHLNDCDACRFERERLLTFPLRVGDLPVVPPPPDFTARLMRRIEVLPPPNELQLGPRSSRGSPFDGAAGAILAFSVAAAAMVLGVVSTTFLALLDGRARLAPAGDAAVPFQSIAAALGGWLAAQLSVILSWPVLLAFWGMQLVLAVLWFRAIAPRRRRSFFD